MNAVGQSVDHITLNQVEVTYDMTHLPAGLYIVAIYRNSIRVDTKKILKQ